MKKITFSLSSGLNKEDHMVVAQRLGDMEKRRVGTRFIDREATEEDQAKPLMEILGTGIWLKAAWKSFLDINLKPFQFPLILKRILISIELSL